MKNPMTEVVEVALAVRMMFVAFVVVAVGVMVGTLREVFDPNLVIPMLINSPLHSAMSKLRMFSKQIVSSLGR